MIRMAARTPPPAMTATPAIAPTAIPATAPSDNLLLPLSSSFSVVVCVASTGVGVTATDIVSRTEGREGVAAVEEVGVGAREEVVQFSDTSVELVELVEFTHPAGNTGLAK